MIIKSKNFDLKIEEILKDDLPIQTFNEYETLALILVKDWFSGQAQFTHQTSGSTGKPKEITLSRKKIEISTSATQKFIDPLLQIKSSLLCLNPKSIGGAMVLYRALILDQDVTIVPPSANPLHHIDDHEKFDIVSIAPIQFQNLNDSDIERFKTILIGGAPVPIVKNTTKTAIYSSFGMTETVSHVALRKIEDDFFQTTGDTVVAAESDGSLKLKGAITDSQWLHTNDLVEVQSKNSFKWLGRKDFVINSGGIKISPEMVEQSLKDQLDDDFMIGFLPDDILGNKLILIANENEKHLDFSHLHKYHKPKEVFFNQKIFKTKSDKLDRIKTQEYFQNRL